MGILASQVIYERARDLEYAVKRLDAGDAAEARETVLDVAKRLRAVLPKVERLEE